MADRVDPNELRPADILILYYCYSNGQGTARNIATTISRARAYVSDRISTLSGEEYQLLERVDAADGPVTLTDAGLTLIEAAAETHVLPDQRDEIRSATPYSVTWE